MRFSKLKSLLLYAGIGRDEYSMISPMIWKGNMKTLRITIGFALGIGVIFLIPNLLTRPDYSRPYIVLILGSLVSLGVFLLIRHYDIQSTKLSMAVCYGQLFLIFLYSCLLSIQPANHDLPGVSVIVFITLLPLTIDDRPIRMFAFIIVEAAIYIIASYYSKNTRVFLGDIEDTVSFASDRDGLVCSNMYAKCKRALSKREDREDSEERHFFASYRGRRAR